MTDRAALGAVIAAEFAEWDLRPAALLERERAMYGSADAEEIAHQIDAFCATHLGSHIETYMFYTSSQSGVSGVLLADGRRVVLKAHTPTWPLDFLRAVHRVQGYLAAHDFPCPRPLLAPARLGYGYATVEEFVDEGGYADAHQPAIRRTMAATLAHLIRATQRLRKWEGLRPVPLPPGALWPAPHSPIFDFAATTAGAEWIDHLAAAAREILACRTGTMVIGHTDWSTQNCRFLGETLRVVYDWDSLTCDKETTIVAQAATTFPMNWLLMEPPVAPSPEEARAFVAEYEAVRGARFTGAEWEDLAAAATYALAYSARLEHSLDPTGKEFPVGGGRARLAAYGVEFLRR
jgi:hypothetical protein